MFKLITAVLIACMIRVPVTDYQSIGEQRITSYCPACNDGQGYESTSGKELRYGYVACNWLPNGTKLSIEGEIYEVQDTCGTEAIDIFIDTDQCYCNLNEYRKVVIINENKSNVIDMVRDWIGALASDGVD